MYMSVLVRCIIVWCIDEPLSHDWSQTWTGNWRDLTPAPLTLVSMPSQTQPIIPWPRRIKPRMSHLRTYKNSDTATAYDNLHIPLPNQTELRPWPKTQSSYTLNIPSLDHDQKPLNRHKFQDIFCISCRFQHNANTRDLAGLYTYIRVPFTNQI